MRQTICRRSILTHCIICQLRRLSVMRDSLRVFLGMVVRLFDELPTQMVHETEVGVINEILRANARGRTLHDKSIGREVVATPVPQTLSDVPELVARGARARGVTAAGRRRLQICRRRRTMRRWRVVALWLWL